MIPPDVLDRIMEGIGRIEMELMGDTIGRVEYEEKICVKKLFGLCSCEEERECYVPATVFDRLVFQSLLELKDYFSWEVLERAKRIWVDRERDKYVPTEVALTLLQMAGRELERKKSSPAEWKVYI